ncbi:hypothetical protein LTR95_009868 [Oleoguttula sp. CCFEE 5521]
MVHRSLGRVHIVLFVQEAALAPVSECYYGSEMYDLITVIRIAVWLSYHRLELPFALDHEQGMRNASMIWTYVDTEQWPVGKTKLGRSLSQCLSDLRAFEAHDPRDHVYGVMGLYTSLGQTGYKMPRLLEPDYRTLLPDVLRFATLWAVYEDSDLTIFSRVQMPSGKSPADDDFASWVPRWDRPLSAEGFPASFRSDFGTFGTHTKATTDPRKRLNSQPWGNLRLLHLEGCVAAPITKIWKAGLSSEHQVADILEMIHEAEVTLHRLGHDDTKVLELLAGTLIACSDHQKQPISAAEAVKGFRAWREHLNTTGSKPPSVNAVNTRWFGNTNDRKAAEYQHAMINACERRAIFITGDHVGIGPKVTDVGDVVVILWGCRWPVIVRQDPGRGTGRFVGVAYVHGAMEGEVVAEFDESGREAIMFELR